MLGHNIIARDVYLTKGSAKGIKPRQTESRMRVIPLCIHRLLHRPSNIMCSCVTGRSVFLHMSLIRPRWLAAVPADGQRGHSPGFIVPFHGQENKSALLNYTTHASCITSASIIFANNSGPAQWKKGRKLYAYLVRWEEMSLESRQQLKSQLFYCWAF